MKNGFEMTRPETKRANLFKRLMILFVVTTLVFGGGLAFLVYANFDYLAYKIIIAGNYVFTDTLDAVYTQTIGAAPVGEKKNYFKNFDEVVISVVSSKIKDVGGDRYTYLYTPQQYQLSQEMTKTVANETVIRELTPDTVYLNLPNISPFTKKFIVDGKAALNGYNNIIIDLRSNPGGTLKDLYSVCDLFLDAKAVIGSEETRFPLFTKTIRSRGSKYFEFDKIILLQNGGTASAAEGFINALRENLDNVTIVGTQSFGKGIGQFTLSVKEGYAIKATTLKIGTPNGETIHGVGITPDIEYSGEDIIDFALGLITEK